VNARFFSRFARISLGFRKVLWVFKDFCWDSLSSCGFSEFLRVQMRILLVSIELLRVCGKLHKERLCNSLGFRFFWGGRK